MQPAPGTTCTPPTIIAENTPLQVVESFCYLGSIISVDVNIDSDISARLAKANYAFERLSKSLWDNHGITLSTKVAVYNSAVLTVLLYGSESWTLYRRHTRKLHQFHMRCLRRIAHISWQDKVSNTEVLEICKTTGIEAYLLSVQLRWAGHVSRMPNDRLPKMIFYGQLEQGTRLQGGQRKRYKDALKYQLKECEIRPEQFENIASERGSWRTLCKSAVASYEVKRVQLLQEKRRARKTKVNQPPSQQTITNGAFQCHICGKVCAARIGLVSHLRTHP